MDHADASPGDAGSPDAVQPCEQHVMTEHEALQLREAQLRGIVDAASEGILTINEAQTIVMANQMAADMFRCPVASLVGAPLERLIPERMRQAHRQAVAAFGAAQAPARRMMGRRGVVGLRADGEEFPMEAGISQASADDTRLYTVIFRDLSEPRRAAAELRTSQELLAATFNVSTVGMAHVDPATGRFTAVNARFCEITGRDQDHLLSMGPDGVLPPQGASGAAPPQGTDQVAAHCRGERPIVRPDGRTVWVELASSVVHDERGAPVRVVCVMQDVTARRAAEQALRAREARQSFLVRLNDRLRGLDAPAAMCEAACRMLGDFLGADRVGYAEDGGDAETVTVRGHYLHGVGGIEGTYRYRDFGVGLRPALQAGCTVVHADVTHDAALSPSERQAHADLQVASSVVVPLLRGGGLQAVLFVHSARPRAWAPEEVTLVEEVGERISADLERARVEADVRATKAKLEAALASMTDVVAIADANGRVTDVNAAFWAFHRLPETDPRPGTLASIEELLEVTLSDGSPAALDSWAIPRALRGETGRNVEFGVRHRRTGERWVGSFGFAPMRDAQGAIVGAVVTGRDVTELHRMQSELEDSHAELQRLLAAQDSVQERERVRIARELHDDLQQSLAAILMEAAVVRSAAAGFDAGAQRALDRIELLGVEVIRAMRRIIHDLRPQALEELGMVAALHTLASSFAERHGVRCTVDVSSLGGGDHAALADLATALYRVVQEALNNVARHAHAQAATVRLASLPEGGVLLCVEDDGVGMDRDARPGPESYGLLGMRERVRVAGGTLVVSGSPGRGTRVEVRIPWPEAPHRMRY